MTDTLMKTLGAAALVCLFAASPAAVASDDLARAAEQGNLAMVNSLLQQGVAVDSRLLDGTTALHWAVLRDQRDAAARLIEAGADPAAVNRNGVTPLYLAAQNGNAAIMTMLLEAGASPNAASLSGETILMTAVRTGRPALVDLLIANGALVDVREPAFEQTALMLAAREDHPKVVELLIRHGAKVNVQTRRGDVPIFLPPCKGTGCGSEGVGINRSGVPDRGERHAAKGRMTPLLYAARDGHPEVARLLLDAGAELELAEINRITPLLMALLNNQLEVASLLLERGAEVNVSDFWGRSPLFAAVDYRNLDMNSDLEDDPQDNGVDRAAILPMIERLLREGADPDARTTEWPPEKKWLYALNDVSWVDMTGQTPFLRAALAGDTTVMRLLLEHGADPHMTTYGGTTALMAAAGVNWTVAQTYTESPQALMEAIKLCLELGADINAANSMGLTPLLGAANRGSNDIIRYLVEQGARLDIQDAVGRTPLRWAEGVFLAAVGAQQKPETIALLRELMNEAGIDHE